METQTHHGKIAKMIEDLADENESVTELDYISAKRLMLHAECVVSALNAYLYRMKMEFRNAK